MRFGVGFTPENAHQHTVFVPADREMKRKINPVMDEVNKKMGRNTFKLAAMGFQKPALTYRDRLSLRYTMQWKYIIVVKCLEPGNKQNSNNISYSLIF